MRLPTVKIKHDSEEGYANINESDYDPEIHDLLEGEEAPVNDAGSSDDGLPTVDEMRAAISKATGKSPHHNLGRDKLVAQYVALNAED